MNKIKKELKDLLYDKYLNGISLKELSKDFNINYDTLYKIIKIKKILRNAISAALSGKKKHRKTLELLGCTIEQFKVHIESQFKHGMSWNNYGFGTDDKWSLDHIKPLSMFDLSDEKQLEIACHYTNFQPMWCSENFSKGNRYVG